MKSTIRTVTGRNENGTTYDDVREFRFLDEAVQAACVRAFDRRVTVDVFEKNERRARVHGDGGIDNFAPGTGNVEISIPATHAGGF